MNRILDTLAFLAIGICLLPGCATTDKTNYEALPKVMAFPVLDVRVGKAVTIEKVVDFNRLPIRQTMARRKNCNVVYAADRNVKTSVQYSDLASGNSAKLKTLGACGEKYALFICLKQWEYAAGYTCFQSDIEAYLVRTDSGSVCWKNNEKSTVWLGIAGGPLYRAFGDVDPLAANGGGFLNGRIPRLLSTHPDFSRGLP